MSYINISPLPVSTILSIYADRDLIDLNPAYQRQGDVWDLEKRQLLVDSIVNGYDIPKLYFQRYNYGKVINNKKHLYAVIDGKQRLETIWKFIGNEFSLADDTVYLQDSSIDLRGLSYSQIADRYPRIRMKFDGFPLPIQLVDTDDEWLIDDMFSRLNEAVPLNAPEKRNSLGGPIPVLIRDISKHKFLTSILPFDNKRYRHYDIAVKFLFIESENKVVDTKKVYLDNFVKNGRSFPQQRVDFLKDKTDAVLKEMASVFISKDPLLKSAGMITVYYHLFRMIVSKALTVNVSRVDLMNFEQLRISNKNTAEQDIALADYSLLEFDRYAQTPNDAFANRLKLEVLLKYAFNIVLKKPLEIFS